MILLLTQSLAMACARRIYAERVALNQRVAGMLRAAEAAGPDLAPLLADLKANLAAEMRAASEQHFLLLRMLLSPTQVHQACRIQRASTLWMFKQPHTKPLHNHLSCILGSAVLKCRI